MSTIVWVIFERHCEFEIIANPLGSRDEATHWLDAQWDELGCEPANPMGKVLIYDKVLGVALNGGSKRFAESSEWSQRYADAVATVIDRPVISVNVADRVVG